MRLLARFRLRSHPKFSEKPFSDATEEAWARNRLCLVYIAADGVGGGKAAKVDDAVCKALADPKVKQKNTMKHKLGGARLN